MKLRALSHALPASPESQSGFTTSAVERALCFSDATSKQLCDGRPRKAARIETATGEWFTEVQGAVLILEPMRRLESIELIVRGGFKSRAVHHKAVSIDLLRECV